MEQSKKSVLITGANGYLGKETIKCLSQNAENYKNIVAMDIRDIADDIKDLPIIYEKCDIRDSKIEEIIKKYSIDIVVHLASIVTPGKKSNRDLEYSVDVLGTKNVIKACIANNCKKIIVSSSGAAYGYHHDNPEWLVETHPLRGNQEFAYSHHKRIVEHMLAEYRVTNPELKQLIFRSGTILGKNVSNQITDLFKKSFIIGICGSKSPFVFIWDKDAAQCLIEGINSDKEGIYNLAGDGKLDMPELAKILKKPYIQLPAILIQSILKVLKTLGLTQYGPEQINFLRYRPVLLNTALKEKFGYIPQKSSKETFLYYLESQK